jgi:hypothetical protein
MKCYSENRKRKQMDGGKYLDVFLPFLHNDSQCNVVEISAKTSLHFQVFRHCIFHCHHSLLIIYCIGCTFQFLLKVGIEESIVNASRISCLNLTSLFVMFVFLLCRLTSGAFTIDSSMPSLRGIK